MKLTTLCCVLFAVAACGSKAKNPTTPEGKPIAWADMNKDQREDYMEATVLPTMKEKFVAFDAAKYGEMNCKTCHGAGAEDQTFKMPNADLPKLDFSKKEEDYTEEQRKTGEFMDTIVVPTMADLLGTKPFDPATQEGFGCLGCHTTTDSK